MRDVVRHLIDALEQGRELILCQVVETRGSTPQKAGALMVVDPGRRPGRHARRRLRRERGQAERDPPARRRPGRSLQSFVLDHDYAWADGLICGGKMVIVTEALARRRAARLLPRLLRPARGGRGVHRGRRRRSRAARAACRSGGRFLFDADGDRFARAGRRGRSAKASPSRIAPLTDRPRPAVRGGRGLPADAAAGPAGHRRRGARRAGGRRAWRPQADFDVWVVDDRQQYANPERFPDGRAHPRRADRGGPRASLEVTPQHLCPDRHPRPRPRPGSALHLAPTAGLYVGLIGSRRKIKLIFESLREQGHRRERPGARGRPGGLGHRLADVPEIAISIVAELIARRNLGPSGLATAGRSPWHAEASCKTIPPSCRPPERAGGWASPSCSSRSAASPSSAGSSSALLEGGAEPVIVVVSPGRPARGTAVAEAARRAGATVITPRADLPK